MKDLSFELITDWRWQNPITASQLRTRLILILPFAVLTYFFFSLIFVLAPFVVMSYHRRLIDLLGAEFYQGQRLLFVWLGIMVIGSIPFLGPFINLWMFGWWTRQGVRDGLNQLFERVELI